jgi:N-acetylmuramoyl-L-alanine amidase
LILLGTSTRPGDAAETISTAEATRFVTDYYKALSRKDVSNVASKFADSVSYREDRQRDRAFIEKDLRDYIARWPRLSLKPEGVAVSANADGSTTVTFNLAYSVGNDSGKSLSGHSANTWVVRRANESLEIISQREVVHSDARPLVEASSSHDEQEAASDEDLKKSGDTQIQIPTAKSTPRSEKSFAKSRAPADFVIALDIGHSPLKGGAVSARGVFEYEFNKRLVSELFAELQSLGFTRSFVINPQGDEIRLPQRSAAANSQDADLFLAIHHDSVKDRFLKTWETEGTTQKYCDDFHGYSIFMSNKNGQPAASLAFATKLGQAMLKAGFTPTLHHAAQENRPVLDKQKGIYAFDDLVVLKMAKMPAVLLECGVIVNRAEEKNLNDPGYRKRLIGAICRAVQDFAAAPAKKD